LTAACVFSEDDSAEDEEGEDEEEGASVRKSRKQSAAEWE
jgi:hypothetical protein